jgi:hypothetical protein
VNIPEIGEDPDVQYPDNVVGEAEDCGKEFPKGSGLYWGCESGIHELFNTVDERWIADVGPVVEYYIDETKEPRFDTNLLEEKFTEPFEEWRWINIETMPWDYTEFVLPEIPDIAEGVGYIGDYILVSSWLTEDSDWVEHGFGAVRMKFSYDATNGTGIYVNRHGMTCIGDITGDGVVNMDDVWPLVNRWNVAKGEPDYDPLYDLNSDDIIDLADIMIVVSNWGPCS